jgi:hypothetical protein
MRKGLPPELCRAVDQALDPRPERRPRPEELAGVFRETAGELSDEGALDAGELREGRPARTRVRLQARAFAGVSAGLLTLAVLSILSPPTTFQPAAAAGITAVVVALLPRIGWIAMAVTLCGWLASPAVARDGNAVMLLAACLPIPFLLPRAPATWTLPAAAPLLALAGAGPAYAGLAGQASTWGRRAALGALGYLWVALAEAAVRNPLLFGLAGGQQPRHAWIHDGWRALAHGVAPVFGSPVMLAAVVFAGFAALLPVLVRGIRLAADVLAAAVWAAGLYGAIAGVERLAGPGVHARGAVGGATLAAGIAVAAAAARRSARQAAVEHEPVP